MRNVLHSFLSLFAATAFSAGLIGCVAGEAPSDATNSNVKSGADIRIPNTDIGSSEETNFILKANQTKRVLCNGDNAQSELTFSVSPADGAMTGHILAQLTPTNLSYELEYDGDSAGFKHSVVGVPREDRRWDNFYITNQLQGDHIVVVSNYADRDMNMRAWCQIN